MSYGMYGGIGAGLSIIGQEMIRSVRAEEEREFRRALEESRLKAEEEMRLRLIGAEGERQERLERIRAENTRTQADEAHRRQTETLARQLSLTTGVPLESIKQELGIPVERMPEAPGDGIDSQRPSAPITDAQRRAIAKALKLDIPTPEDETFKREQQRLQLTVLEQQAAAAGAQANAARAAAARAAQQQQSKELMGGLPIGTVLETYNRALKNTQDTISNISNQLHELKSKPQMGPKEVHSNRIKELEELLKKYQSKYEKIETLGPFGYIGSLLGIPSAQAGDKDKPATPASKDDKGKPTADAGKGSGPKPLKSPNELQELMDQQTPTVIYIPGSGFFISGGNKMFPIAP